MAFREGHPELGGELGSVCDVFRDLQSREQGAGLMEVRHNCLLVALSVGEGGQVEVDAVQFKPRLGGR